MATDKTDLQLQKDAYIAFDSLSLKDQINKRLTKGGILTDQRYEGSNISEVRDIVAYVFHVLMYYLNRTSSESMFSLSQLYENMNRIVKKLDYNPVGAQTATLAFTASATGLNKGFYTIPRYSYISLGRINYSCNEDITFAKTVNQTAEFLTDLSKQKLLFQGQYIEYPIYTATGTPNELIYLIGDKNEIIDHFNIDVYVYSNGKWSQFERTTSLYLEDAIAAKYEIRFNENKHYEIKFGNDINGQKLNEGDQVAIYYLSSLGSAGEVGAGALTNHLLSNYQTVQFNAIMTDVVANQYQLLTTTDLQKIKFTNDMISTSFNTPETVEDIRQNAPATFRSQYRLVTERDYETFVKTNYANLIHDVKVVNNTGYLTENLKYYFDIGLTNPNLESRALLAQINFSDACNFNNVYITCVPRTIISASVQDSYLTPSQKTLIISAMRPYKTTTSEIVLLDPTYIAVDIAIGDNSSPQLSDAKNSKLLIVKEKTSRRDDVSIKGDVVKVFTDYFNRGNVSLGQTIDINILSSGILAIPGVQTFYTVQGVTKYEGLGLLVWNPLYPSTDIQLTLKNVALQYFKYPYLSDPTGIASKVEVQADQVYQSIDY